jgi:hypothetical protein
MMNEKHCKIKIVEPNGMRLTVARAINGGDFQASHACKGCKNPCDQDDDF